MTCDIIIVAERVSERGVFHLVHAVLQGELDLAA
jgi:hypothetical protein